MTWRMADSAAGSGWYMVGDAAAILDPTSSRGVLKALMTGVMAGHLIAGVLHGRAVMLLVARLAAPLRSGLWLAGALAILLPRLVQLPALDGPWGNWTGLVTRKPVTEDYVPVLPWLGVMLWGLAAGQWLQRARPAWLAVPLSAAWRPLLTLGRWPLTVYMLHQPLFFGLLMGWGLLKGQG